MQTVVPSNREDVLIITHVGSVEDGSKLAGDLLAYMYRAGAQGHRSTR